MGVKMPNFKEVDWHQFFIGSYDWKFLCTPRLPCGKRVRPPPFFAKDEPISMFIAFVMGLQHCLTMVAGVITVPLVLSSGFVANFSSEGASYLISASLIVSGTATLIQVIQIKIPYTPYVIGSGLLAVMGVSFTFLPISQSVIPKLTTCYCGEGGQRCFPGRDQYDVPNCYDVCGDVPLYGNCNTGEQAYGKILGTVMVACWLEVAISFIPLPILRKLFPPVVTGTTVLLIGIALTKVGIGYWGGGAYCAEQVLTSQALCDGNGEVQLPFGSPQYVGLGFSVFATLVIVEIFGSPFMRNIQVIIGLLVGMIVASSVSVYNCTADDPVCTTTCYDVLPAGVTFNNATNTVIGTPNTTVPGTNWTSTVCQKSCVNPNTTTCETQRFVTGQIISEAQWITFLWVNTYPLGFYAPALLPILFAFLVTSMECIGDITATTEASGLVPVGPEYERSIQGGLLADGLACFWGALATVLPCVTFAENNGVVSLTRCAARRAGVACAILLMILGIIQKFAAIVRTIPDCVLGGVAAFLFINVALSGMRILTLEGGINRRSRFIAAMALTVGVGVSLIPPWFNISGQFKFPLEGWLWPINPTWSSGMAGFRDAIIILITSGFSIGGIIALILNLMLPFEADDEDELLGLDPHANTKMGILQEEYPHPVSDNKEDPLHPKHDDIPVSAESASLPKTAETPAEAAV